MLGRMLAALLVMAGGVRVASAEDDRALLRAIEQAFVRIGEQVVPWVVSIEVEANPSEEVQEYLDQFGVQAPSHASGSGILYDALGNILTNNHVVEGAESISVSLSNGTSYDARVIGSDPDTDLAVIKIDATGPITPAVLGDSDRIKIGQFAIAVGSARGLSGSMSFGHITGLGRTDLALDENLRFQDFVQTDAAINLGNSGGPLCNIEGEVIGINTAIVPGADSLGFAIPINMVKRFVPELIARGKVTRGYLGVSIFNVTDGDAGDLPIPSSKEIVESLELPDTRGAYVHGMADESPALKAGIREGDVIRRLNDIPIQNKNDLTSRVAEMPPGAVVQVEVWRRELGKPGGAVQIKVDLDEYPGSLRLARLGRPILGM